MLEKNIVSERPLTLKKGACLYQRDRTHHGNSSVCEAEDAATHKKEKKIDMREKLNYHDTSFTNHGYI